MAGSSSKRVVITGASSGIGAATAQAFAEQGARIVLAARNREALEKTGETCRRAGTEVLIVPTDVTDAQAVAELARQARSWLGHIDLWFSNVGIGVVGKFHDVPIADHRRVIEANLIGHLNDAHGVLPIFLEQKRGTFVNMISVGGFVPAPWATAYTASKFGLRGLSQALRGEVSEYPDIHICDIYPTFVDSPAIRHAGNYTGGETTVPPGVLDPRSVARAVVSLSDRPRDTTALGAPALLMKLAQFLMPSLSANFMNRAMGSHFRRADPASPTSGNLFAPPADDGQIDGGYRRPEQRKAAAAGAAAIVGVAMIAGAALMRWRRRRS